MGTFDPARAEAFAPREEVEKVAILLTPAPSTSEIKLSTPFGPETLRGAFYLVAEGEASYGAAKREFEASHRHVGGHRWVKTARVAAYQVTEQCSVDTIIAGELETRVNAEAGDWIVRQATGELMVLSDDVFTSRYAPTDQEPGT